MQPIFVCRIGPLPDTGGMYLYLPLAEGESLAPIEALNDEEGLRRVSEAYPGRQLTCESELEAAGRTLGYQTVPSSLEHMRDCASAAAGIALRERMHGQVHPAVLMTFLEQASHFWKSESLKKWATSSLLNVAMTGRYAGYKVNETFECTVSSGPPAEVMLFSETGNAQRLLELTSSELFDEANDIDRLVVRFDEEPAYAVSALAQGWGMKTLPVPLSLIAGKLYLVDERDLVTLSASLWALTWLIHEGVARPYQKDFVDALGNELLVTVSAAGSLTLPGRGGEDEQS